MLRKTCKILLVGCCYISSLPAFADVISTGNWEIKAVKDPNTSKNMTIAVTRSDDRDGVLEIRCYPRDGLSARVVFNRLMKHVDSEAGIHIKYHADNGSPWGDKAWPFGKSGVVMPNGRQILEDAMKPSALYIEIDTPDGLTTDLVFRPGEAPTALSQLQADCPKDAAPPDSNGQAK